jgi:hypothetical protein
VVPDLLGHRVIRGELVRVVELVGPVAPVRLRDQASGFDHVACELLRHAPGVAWDDLELGPEQLHVVELLLRERIR